MSKKLVSIGEAAKFLDVSVDTVRRWDSQGILHSSRPDGKDRYFSLDELEKVRFAKPLQISEAAERLGISETTLRRLENQGMIKPERNAQGERLYTRNCLKNFLDSDYYLRQKSVESRILDPENEENDETAEEKSQRMATQRKIINAQVEEHQQKINHLIIFRNIFYGTGLSLVTFLIFSVIIIAVLFLLNPKGTAKWFGYRVSNQTAQVSSGSKQVLGAEYQPPAKVEPKNVWAKVLKPFSQISLGVVKEVNAATYYKIVPVQTIDDVNDVLGIDSSKNVVSKYSLTFPDSSYLIIPDTDLIQNLNADYIRGKVPGTGAGNLAYYDANGEIAGLKINSDQFNASQTTTTPTNQDLSGLVTKTTTVNGQALSANVTITATDLGLGSVENTALSTWAGSTNIVTVGTLATASGNISLWTNDAGYISVVPAETDPVAMGYLDQSVKTTSSPSFTGLTVGTLSGILKGTAGAVSAITDNSANWDAAFGSSHAAVTIGAPANGLSLSTQQLSLALSSAGTTGALSAADWGTFSGKQGALTFGDLTAASNKIAIGGTGVGALIGVGASVDVTEANITHNNLAGLTTGDPHTQYGLLIGRSGGQSLSGGTDANDDLTLQGTTNGTRTTSYINLQPNGGNVGIGTATPATALDLGSGSLTFVTTTSSTTGVIYKGTDRFIHNYAPSGSVGQNTFAGVLSGNFTATYSSGDDSSRNTALGYSTLNALTTGNYNTAIGWNTGKAITTGLYNNVIGANAGLGIDTGSSNNLQGLSAGRGITSGSSNTAIGESTLRFSNGDYNTAIGYRALFSTSETDFSNSIGIGANAGRYETASNKLFIDGLDRGSEALGRTDSLIYGVMNVTPANQILSLGGGGKVGIGTTSPASRLHIGVAPTASANYGTFSLGGGAFDGLTAGKFLGSASGTSLAIDEANGYTGNLIDAQVNGVSNFSVTGAGKTIIGVPASTQATLNVGGNFSVDGTTGNAFGGSGVNYVGVNYTGAMTVNNPYSAGSMFQQVITSNSNSGANWWEGDSSLLMAGGFNVAAGVSKNILADVRIFGLYGTIGAGGSVTTAASLYIDNAPSIGTNKYAIYSALGQNYFGGNVGIGTTGPDFKLDVSGGLRIEGANALSFGGTAAGDTLGNLYHDGTDFVFSDTIKPTGYKSSDGSAGLSSAVTVKGSDGNDCVMTFKDGLLTSETCP